MSRRGESSLAVWRNQIEADRRTSYTPESAAPPSYNLFLHQSAQSPFENVVCRARALRRRRGRTGPAGAAAARAGGGGGRGRDDGLLLVNAEGRFRDVRQRPIQVAPGLAHLAKWAPAAQFTPLAIEYAFWDERRPNLLLRFGEPVSAQDVRDAGPAALNRALACTMDALGADAASRDPARFTTLLAGQTQISPVYDSWRRVRALLQGRRFDPAHSSAGRNAAA